MAKKWKAPEWELREQECQVLSKGGNLIHRDTRAVLYRRGVRFASYAIETKFKAVARQLRSTLKVSFLAFSSDGTQV